jgi:uncharacterized membrane protein YgdD (TMEM256/DUF423 family)
MSIFSRNQLLIGALFLLVGIILGALGAHAFADILSDRQMASFQTAVRYQQLQGIGIMIVGVVCHISALTASRWITRFLVLGTILFSGSIYLLVFSTDMAHGLKAVVGPITPIGGLLLILGWAFFLRSVAVLKVSK